MDKILKEAQEAARHGQIDTAFEAYAAFFYSRLRSINKNRVEFNAFYRYELALYLLNKKNTILALTEGDMISDLIEESYNSFISELESSPIRVTLQGRVNLLSELRIHFPILKDVEEEERAVSK